MSQTIVVSLLAMSLGDWLDMGRWVGTPWIGGGGLVHPREKTAWPPLGLDVKI